MNSPLSLSYTEPANHWTSALPLGNGRLGAMHFGGVPHDQLQLNKDTLWSGKHRDWNNPAMRAVLPQVRAALHAGDYPLADQLARGLFGPWTESYLPLGDLHLDFPGLDESEISHYRRELDLDGALASVTFQHRGITYRREAFASFPDQIIALRLTADRPGALTFTARLTSELPHDVLTQDNDTLRLTGQAPEHVEPNYVENVLIPIRYGHRDDTIRFIAQLHVSTEGGAVTAGARELQIKEATSVTLLLSMATSFQGFNQPLEPEKAVSTAAQKLTRVSTQSFDQLLATHQADHRELFRRVELDLGTAPSAEWSTEERIRRWTATSDPQLVALLYQFGRYLMIASSRPGTQATTLQGIWNDQMRAPWSSNYTLNINTPMNYWPAESANLAECHQPLFSLIRDLAVTGAETARVNYGARGWLAHHNTDLWRHTAPVSGQTKWATWYVGGAWLCQHLWEHYAFGHDTDYLRNEAWPLMKGAAEFCLDWLTEDRDGHLVTSLSTSPETNFVLPYGTLAGLSMGSTMDMAIIRELFTACLAASTELGIDDAFTQEIANALPRLLPAQIGANGCIQEWAHDWPSEEIHHRHVSFLFGLHPGSQITDQQTPDLFHAAATSLRARGDAGTGWSLAWKINLWARLRDGDHALGLIGRLLTLCPAGNTVSEAGGIYPNLFDAHPPFQIDGNFGVTSGITEMLLQSHANGIDPLPALPTAWTTGRVKGLRARGGFVVDLDWRDRHWQTIRILSHRSTPCRVRTGSAPFTLTINGAAHAVAPDASGWITFPLETGAQAELHPL
ncbi:MAG: hypothetical protein B9S32_14425 [Verrucomicrobia bacterium Tous-C9LFEB]|nr:MAG: hypothetical protein B9S32_14425 [Verrucomicrobia bacterium Tous-C9LFEB]